MKLIITSGNPQHPVDGVSCLTDGQYEKTYKYANIKPGNYRIKRLYGSLLRPVRLDGFLQLWTMIFVSTNWPRPVDPVRIRKLLARILESAVITCAISLPVQATDALSIDQIMDLSGLSGQLSSLSGELQPLLKDATANCKTRPAQALPEGLSDQYTVQSLHRHARTILERKLDTQTVSALAAWYQSPGGRRIVHAEKSAAHWDETKFDQRIAGMTASADWHELRRKLVLRTVASTQAHKYVASLSASVAALKQALKRCADGFSLENRQAAQRQVENERDLLAAFLRLELIVPSAAVYQDISRTDLEAYANFARTPVGRHFHLTLAQLFSELLFFPEGLAAGH